jgi:hypothetical protein
MDVRKVGRNEGSKEGMIKRAKEIEAWNESVAKCNETRKEARQQ